MDIILAVHLSNRKGPRLGEAMFAVNGQNHPLAK
jgi:hypothetical protein